MLSTDDLIRLPGASAGSVWVVRAEGGVDQVDGSVTRLVPRLPSECVAVVVDLSYARPATAGGNLGLARSRRLVERTGRRWFVVAPAGRPLDGLTPLRSVAQVIDACTTAVDGVSGAGSAPVSVRTAQDGERVLPDRPELAQLRAEVLNLRVMARSSRQVALALGILRERYRLPEGEVAFALLDSVSQRFNIRLRSLAAALITTPRPAGGTAEWFPGRTHAPAPTLSFLPGHRPDRLGRGQVIARVLDRTLEISQTGMGHVQLVDPADGGLQLEKHQGLSRDFVAFFDHVDGDGTSCALAARQTVRVTVTDVETDPVFTEPARQMILSAGRPRVPAPSGHPAPTRDEGSTRAGSKVTRGLPGLRAGRTRVRGFGEVECIGR